MSSHSYTFWTHGASVQVEDSGGDRGLVVVRTGLGTKIRQNRGTANWFHLAVPTPTALDGWTVEHRDARLRVEVNGDAAIKKIHVRESAWESPGECPKIWDSGDINITGQAAEVPLDLPNGKVDGPVAICAYVEFGGDRGEIRFIGAGVRFKGKD
jgi:hypothetical protein